MSDLHVASPGCYKTRLTGPKSSELNCRERSVSISFRPDFIQRFAYTDFPRSCNNTVQAKLRMRKIASRKFDSPQL